MSLSHVKYFLVGLLAFSGLTAVPALAEDVTVTGPETTTQINGGSGNVTVTESGSITTTVNDGLGIATSGENTTITNAGSISTAGDDSYGIAALGANTTIANAGTISTTGALSYGIAAGGANTTITNTDTIGTTGANSYGIIASGANTTITNARSITTTGQSGYGIAAIGTNNIITNAGMISTMGQSGYGIAAGGVNATITNAGSITTTGQSAHGMYAIGANSTIANTNTGTISTNGNDSWGITAEGVNATITNAGSINTTGRSSSGIKTAGDGANILNSGSITTSGNGDVQQDLYADGIAVFGTNTKITNTRSGTIHVAGQDTAAIYVSASATNGSVDNAGNVSAISNGNISGFGIFNYGGIDTLNNSGTISAGDNGFGIANKGGVNTLNNSGTISAGNNGFGIDNRDTGYITILTNSGTISSGVGGFGISNGSTGTIATLTNAQGGNVSSAATTALTYTGVLPNNYNIIISSSTHYGQLVVTNGTGTTTFGVSSLTTTSRSIINATFASVLTGISATQLGLPGLTSFSGVSSIYSYLLTLTDPVLNIWGLTITACQICKITIASGETVTLSQLSGEPNLIMAGGTLALSNGDQSSQSFFVASTSTITAPTTGSATLSGVFSGPGGLIFNGVGTTRLTGANTYTGGTTVSSGTLSVSGASPTGFGNVLVSSGATLMGTGTINGQLTVAGILKPGNSPGYLAATNTVTMNAGSTYVQDIAGTVQASNTSPVGASGYYSFLNVTSGQFVIQPGATLVPRLSNLFSANQPGYGSAIYVPSLGDRLRIVTAAGGISGRFSALTQPAELAAGTQYIPFYNMAGSNSVDLSVIPTAYQTTIASASGNANAKSVGAALTQIAKASMAGTATPAQERLLYSIAGQTTAQGISNFAQSLSGEVYAATVAVLAQTTQRTQQAVLNRLGDTAGLTMTTPMTSASTSTQMGGAPSAAVSSNPSVNPSAEAKSFSKGNVWGELAYQRGNRSSDSQSGGWSSNLYQLTFGSDFYSSNGTTLGGGLALSSTTVNPAYGSATIQQGSLFAYGKMPVESFVLDAMASVGLSSSDIKRGDVTGLSAGFRNNAVSGNDLMLSLGVSRPMDLESLRITPFARVTWQMVSQSGANEGNAASALSVKGFTGNGVRGMLGVAAGSKDNNPMTAKYTYRAYVGVGADSSGLLNPTLNASLAGIGTNITTPNAGTTFVQAGLYGTAKMSENTFAYAGISGEARSGQTLGTINLGLKVQF
jgi:uncharacterized protein with beta-barrel porin domain